MLVVGLTGGIASGKSLAANYFAELGVDIIDADVIARDIVQPDMPAYKKIIEHFSEKILDKSGRINRKKLRKIIFENPTEKKWLEALLHPIVRDSMREKIKSSTSNYCILVIPLLIETLPNSLIDRILVIDCDESIQIQRVMARDGCDEAAAKKIINQQASRERRLDKADDVILNNADLIQLKNAASKQHLIYLSHV